MAARGGRIRSRTRSHRCRRAPASSSFTTRRGPFATADLFTRVIEAAARGGAAIAALQASDTVKEATAAPGVKIVARTIVRESIYLAQTPQAFNRTVLEDAIARGRESIGAATDEASLAEEAGYSVRLVDGESTNIKITTQHDLRVSKALLDDGRRIPNPKSLIPQSGNRVRPPSPRSRQAAHYRRSDYSARDRPCRSFGRGRAVSCGDRRNSRRGSRRRHRPALSRHGSEMERREQHRSAERRGRDRPRGGLRRLRTSMPSSSRSVRSWRRTFPPCARTSRRRSESTCPPSASKARRTRRSTPWAATKRSRCMRLRLLSQSQEPRA